MSLKILNEGFLDRYPDLKEETTRLSSAAAFLESLKRKIRSLAEAEMSAEDKRDSEILKQIYRKTQARANAALTPEEKEVLKKYDLERNPDTKNIRLATRDIPGYRAYMFGRDDDVTRIDPKTGGIYKPSDKINYADKARKRPERGLQNTRFDYDYLAPAPDYEREHRVDDDEYWNGTKYQRAERIADNREMTKNVRKMKDLLHTRNKAQQFIDNSQEEQDAKIDKIKAAYERRLADLKKSYDDKTRHSTYKIDRANNEINALLKKGAD